MPRRKFNFWIVLTFLFAGALLGVLAFNRFYPKEPVEEPTIPPTLTWTVEVIKPALVDQIEGVVVYEDPETGARFLKPQDAIDAGPGTTITLNGPGRLRMGMIDGSLLILDGSTQIELQQIAGQLEEINETRILLTQGKLLAALTLKPGYVFTVLSPLNGQAQVTGSVMGVEYDPLSQTFRLDCIEGKCSLANQNGARLELGPWESAVMVGYNAPEYAGAVQPERYPFGDEGQVPTSTATLIPTDTPVLPTATEISTPVPTQGSAGQKTPQPAKTPTRTRKPKDTDAPQPPAPVDTTEVYPPPVVTTEPPPIVTTEPPPIGTLVSTPR